MPLIALDARLNAYREGGIAEYTRHLAENLAGLDPEGAYALIQHVRMRTPLLKAPNWQLWHAFTPPHHRFERIALALELARWRPTLLHSPDFIPPRFGARHFVITVHDLTFLRYPHFQTADSLRYYRGNFAAALRQAAHILTNAEAIKNELIDLGVPEQRISVHPLGVDHTRFRPLPESEVRRLLAARKVPPGCVLFVGTFEPRKNLSGLLQAYAVLRQKLADAPPLLLIGRRGWLYQEIFAQAKALDLDDHLIWLENLPSAELPAFYNSAAVLVQPSFYEGFGFPPLEAMACGTPTVVSRRGALPEVVGEAGLLVEPEQPEEIAAALARALTDSEFRARSRAAGLERARHFTWQKTAHIVLQVYQRVLG
ncbi:MAG: glycosyltransferase family 1 protein [Candidatus Thermofonsia Clade 1 bacterium]|uniref:Glycosyltransferase family 1 protein n=1 Tax=Candidatus Thermofonsia Clade 1 bacterium TaxID=2364210 RepID=A0A2M8Q021_9CHLR|nr:MAG: glycosyltransferase family 1 protein [Candidatus Thermofonsia Clade 1 bacterium]